MARKMQAFYTRILLIDFAGAFSYTKRRMQTSLLDMEGRNTDVSLTLPANAVEHVRRACDEALSKPGIRKDILSSHDVVRHLLREEVMTYLAGRWNTISPGFMSRPDVPELTEDCVWWEATTPANGIIRVANHHLPDTADVETVLNAEATL